MNLKTTLLILSVIAIIILGLAYKQQQHNQKEILLLQEQIEQQRQVEAQREVEKRWEEQQRLYKINQQREQTFNPEVVQNNRIRTLDERRTDQQRRGISRFCDMNKVFSTRLMHSYQYKGEVLDTSQTTDLLEKQFIDEMLVRMQQQPIATNDAEKPQIIEQFVETEFTACMDFFMNYGNRHFEEIPPPTK